VTWVSAVTLTGTVAIDTGSGVGNITFNQTVNGSEDLTITAGTGDIDFNQSVGQLIRLDQLRIVSATDVSFAAAVSAQNFLQDAGSGTTTFGGMLNTSLAAGVNLTGTNLRVVSGITTTGNGEVLIVLSGSIPNGEAVFENGAHERGWACFHHGSGGLKTGGNITTTNDAITITATTKLTQHVTIDSGPGIGDISFSSTIDGLSDNTQSLTLDAGTGGRVTVNGAIGKSKSLRILTLVDSNNADFGRLVQDDDFIIADTQVRVINSQSGRSFASTAVCRHHSSTRMRDRTRCSLPVPAQTSEPTPVPTITRQFCSTPAWRSSVTATMIF
jgi:hypothetical protein